MTKENLYWIGPVTWKSKRNPPIVVLKVSAEGKILQKIRDPEIDFDVDDTYPFNIEYTIVGERALIKAVFDTKRW